jgi:hypothetical protein
MEQINYEKSFIADKSVNDVDVRDIESQNNFVCVGIFINRGANEVESVVGTLAGEKAGQSKTYTFVTGVVHRFRFSSISKQSNGTTTQEVKLVGV